MLGEKYPVVYAVFWNPGDSEFSIPFVMELKYSKKDKKYYEQDKPKIRPNGSHAISYFLPGDVKLGYENYDTLFSFISSNRSDAELVCQTVEKTAKVIIKNIWNP